MPRESVLGSLLFIRNVADVGELIKSLGLESHFYADDDGQISSCLPPDASLASGDVCSPTSVTQKWGL